MRQTLSLRSALPHCKTKHLKSHIILKSFFNHKLAAMVNSVVIVGLSISLIASMLIAYGRIFRSKKTIMKESQTDGLQNIHEIRHRLLETRIAQIGAALLSIGFALQLTGNFMD